MASFVKLVQALKEADGRGDKAEYWRIFDDMVVEWDRMQGGTSESSRTSGVPSRIADWQNTLVSKTATTVANSTIKQVSGMQSSKGGLLGGLITGSTQTVGTGTFKAIVGDGESITPGDAILVANGVAYLAQADDIDRFCNAYCLSGSGVRGEILYRIPASNEPIQVKLANEVSAGSLLYLSVTPGKLTDDPAESAAKEINQVLGSFITNVTTATGTSGLALMSSHWSPASNLA